MQDWGPVIISFMLFILISPGLIFQIPGKSRTIEFGKFHTSAVSILIHAIIFFALDAFFLFVVEVHIEFGSSQ